LENLTVYPIESLLKYSGLAIRYQRPHSRQPEDIHKEDKDMEDVNDGEAKDTEDMNNGED
jgi:hypothetical protein